MKSPASSEKKAAASAEAPPDVLGRQVADFKLPDHRGHLHSLGELADRKFVVLAFLGTECPLATRYAARLSKLAEEYGPQGVGVLGVDANRQDSLAEIATLVRTQDLKFQVLKDVGNRVADLVGAVRTPEVFVLDERRIIRYYGRIDDQYGIGYARDEPHRRDLAIALDELLAGKPVSVPLTEPTGCHIGRTREPQPDSEVTYGNQISRILAHRCVECHRPGEIAPFSLTEYEDVAGWAATIAEVVRQDRMPPWHANAAAGEFSNDRRLSADEKELIRRWVAAGAPLGDKTQAPAPTPYVDGWNLPKAPDLVVAISEDQIHIPAEGAIKYQYYRVDPKLTSEKWIVAAHVRPGNRAVVHHAMVVLRPPGADDSDVAELDEQILGVYAPGVRPEPFPPGFGKRVPAGSHIAFELHYTPTGKKEQDRTQIGLVFADEKTITRAVMTGEVNHTHFKVPPRDANFRVQKTSPAFPMDAEFMSMMPHMHVRGKSFMYEAVYTDGKRETLLEVPRYDFNWQTSYKLAKPKPLPAGTKINCVGHFDNSVQNLANPDPAETVAWGKQSWQEMMIGYFEFSIPVEQVRNGGQATGPRNAAEQQLYLQAAKLMKRHDKNGDGQVTANELPSNQRAMITAMDKNGDGAVTAEELIKAMKGK